MLSTDKGLSSAICEIPHLITSSRATILDALQNQRVSLERTVRVAHDSSNVLRGTRFRVYVRLFWRVR